MTRDLLFEIGTEEIPARFMAGILQEFESIAHTKLHELRVPYKQIQVVGTPRRLALIIKDMAEQQKDKNSENKGPSVKIAFDAAHQPTKAAQGFARGQGVNPADLVVKDGYVYALVHQAGKPVAALLPDILCSIVDELNFPKNMRWADLDKKFVRPIRWLVALFGNEVIPFTIATVVSGNKTRGHRFLSKGELTVKSVEDYFSVLRENYVIVDQEERRRGIREQVEKLAAAAEGIATVDDDLLEEVVYLVEYPTALCGRFEEKYLSLPPEAVITPMREHQRYFPVVSREGKLLPVFITVRNGNEEHLAIVRHGNERVLRARLADAQFFFEEDKKRKLIDRLDKLKTIVFQEGLGTMYDKTIRIETLALFIADCLGVKEANSSIIERGARLAKTDLVTGMVCEFPELQGTMGREYALLNGEQEEVAQAIFEHYLPRFSGDILPESAAGKVISIADKLDNIVATFSRGLIPTGSQDPYALRRQALGIVNILIAGSYHVSIQKMLDKAMDLLGIAFERRESLSVEIQEFFRLRIKNILTDENIRYDIIDAVMAPGIDDLYDIWLRAKTTDAVIGSNEMQRAVQAFTRVGNLVKNAEGGIIKEELFTTVEERELYCAYQDAYQEIQRMTVQKNYSEVVSAMIKMTQPIDTFFGAVMVMVEEETVRNNRLALLKGITSLVSQMLDVSKIIAG